MKSDIDILGFGCAAVDDVLYVSAYPRRNTKLRVQRRERLYGGLTAAALVAASRLGCKCAYAGVLGDDPDSRCILGWMKREGIDVRLAIQGNGAKPVRSVIIVDELRETRNVFFDSNGAIGAALESPSEKTISSAKVLFLDTFGTAGMIRAARIARKAGIPVVADFESNDAPRFGTLLALVDHLILSKDFAFELTRTKNPVLAANRLWNDGRQVVVVTCGVQGSYYLDRSIRSPKHVPAFKVNARNTTGCGDVFHGAYAAALARGMETPARIQFASAAAALKAAGRQGDSGIPTLAAVEAFLQRHSS